MKYVIDAPLTDVLYAIDNIIETKTEDWEQEGSYGEQPYFQVKKCGTNIFNHDMLIRDLTSNNNDYFNFDGVIFKVNKFQSACGCTVIEELDHLDAQWFLGEFKTIKFAIEMICSYLYHPAGIVKFTDNLSDEFHAIQDNYT